MSPKKSVSMKLPFKLTVTNMLLLLLAGGLIFMALKSAHIIEGVEMPSSVPSMPSMPSIAAAAKPKPSVVKK